MIEWLSESVGCLGSVGARVLVNPKRLLFLVNVGVVLPVPVIIDVLS